MGWADKYTAPLIDWAPDFLTNAVKAGFEESITGMAANITMGGKAFIMPENYDPNLLEKAGSFAASMLWDYGFFVGTSGFGLGARVAGKPAMKLAAQQLARYNFKKVATIEAGSLGIKNATKESTKKAVAAATNKETIAEMLHSLKKIGGDENLLKELANASRKTAMIEIQSVVKNPLRNSFWKEGYKEIAPGVPFKKMTTTNWIGKKVTAEGLEAPGLVKVFHEGGVRTAQALGLYAAIGDTEGQILQNIAKTIDPETGEPYGNKAPNIWDRYKDGETFGEDFDWDVQQTMWATLGGMAGGYVAGGLATVMNAGKLGAFSERGFDKYLTEHHPKVLNTLYSQVVGLPVEASAFVSAEHLLSKISGREELDEDGNPVPWSEKFVHTMVNLGGLKMMHKAGAKWSLHRAKTKDARKREIVERTRKEVEAQQKIIDSQDADIHGKPIIDAAREAQKQADMKMQTELENIDSVFGKITKLFEGTGLKKGEKDRVTGYKKIKLEDGTELHVPRMTVDDLRQLKSLMGTVVELSEKGQTGYGAEPSRIADMRKQDPLFDEFFNAVKEEGGLFDVLEKQIKEGREKSRTPINEAEENTRQAIEKAKKDVEVLNKSEKEMLDIESRIKDVYGEEAAKDYRNEVNRLLAEKEADIEFKSEERLNLINKVQTELDKIGRDWIWDVDPKTKKQFQTPVVEASDAALKSMAKEGQAKHEKALEKKYGKPKEVTIEEEVNKGGNLAKGSYLQQGKGTSSSYDKADIPKAIRAAAEKPTEGKVTSKEQQKDLDKVSKENILAKKLIAKEDIHNRKKPSAIMGDVNTFAKWLWGKHKISILDAKDSHVKEWLNTGSGASEKNNWVGKQYGNLVQKTNNARRWLGYLTNFSNLRNEFTRPAVKIPPGGKKKPGKAEKGLTTREYADVTQKADKIPTGKGKVKGVPARVFHAIQYITGIYGKRRVAIAPERKALDSAYGGQVSKEKVGQFPLRVGDVEYGKEGTIILKIYDKGALETGRETHVVIANEKMPNGINYYKIFDALIKEHQSKKSSPGDYFLQDSRGEGMTNSKVINVQKAVVGEKGMTAMHEFRHTIESIARDITDRLGGKDYVEIMDKRIVEHKAPKGIAEIYLGGVGKFKGRANELYEFHDLARKLAELESTKGLSNPEITKQLREFYVEKYGTIAGEGKAQKFQTELKFETIKERLKTLNNERNLITNPDSGLYHILTRRINELNKRLGSGQKQIWSPYNLITGYEPLRKKQLSDMLDILVKRNPGLILYKRTKGKNAGEIINGAIEVVEGKADVTTFFHENIHRLEGFIRAVGDKKLIESWERGERLIEKWAEKNDGDRWKLFLRKYGERAENEYLTQLGAEWSVERFQAKTKIGEFGVWVREVFSQMKVSLGIGSAKDISRMFGKTAEVGFGTDGIKIDVKKYQKMEGAFDPATPGQKKRIEELQREKELGGEFLPRILDLLGFWDGKKAMPIGDIGISGDRVTGLNIHQAEALKDFLGLQMKNAVNKGPDTKNKAEWQRNNKQAHMMEYQFGIVSDVAKMIKRTIGIHKGSLAYATRRQQRQYMEFIEGFGKKVTPQQSMINESLRADLSKPDSGFGKLGNYMIRRSISLSAVLRKFGGKSGDKLAKRIEDHYMYESRHVGEGMAYVYVAKNYIGEGKMKFIPYILDPDLMLPTIHKGKEIYPKMPTGLDEFRLRYEEGKTNYMSGGKGNKEYLAVDSIDKMYTHYWETLRLYAKEKIKNPKMYEDWERKFNRKFVENYFTRVLTTEAKEYLSIGSKGFDKAMNSLIRDLVKVKTEGLEKELSVLEKEFDSIPLSHRDTRKQIIKIIDAKQKELAGIVEEGLNENSSVYQELSNQAAYIISNYKLRQPNNVQNKYLLDRLPRIDNVLIGDTGKKIQVWETDFEKVAGTYMRTMSNFLATVKTFNEFTSVRGNFADGSGAPMDMLRVISRDSALGEYANDAIKRRIGLEQANIEGSMTTSIFTVAGKYSALFGLSSIASGMKNLGIGTQNTIGIHGFRAYLHGVTKIFRPSNWAYARKKGWLELGTKELELNKWQEKTMNILSQMKRSESINRIVGGFAGEFNARQLVSRFRNKRHSLLGGEWTSERAADVLQKLFHLDVSELAFVKHYGLDKVNIPFEGKGYDRIAKGMDEIIWKIQHYGHIKSQGATGDPFLPLWAGNRNLKALTLFYRMAYSSTANIYHHVMMPATHGNLLPMVRYGAASNLVGSALWAFMEKVIGQAPPKKNEEKLAIIGMNMAKAEALGLFSFVLNPYAKPGFHFGNMLLQDSIMQPAIIKNTGLMLSLMADYVSEDVDFSKSINKNVGSMVVALGHWQKALDNYQNKYKTEVRQIRSWKSAFEKSSGRWEDEGKRVKIFDKQHPNAQYYNLIKEAFYNNDLETAANYYVTTWYYLFDSYRMSMGRLDHNTKASKRNTDSALNNVLNKLNPLDFSDPIKVGSNIDDRKEFLEYLLPEEKEKALRNEKEYWYRRRKFIKQIQNTWNKFGGHYQRGEVIDPFQAITGFPATGGLLGIWDWKGDVEMKESQSEKYRPDIKYGI